MITYQIKKATEEGQEDIIVKTGHEVEFKMSDVRTHMERIDKLEKEMKAQVELEQAKIENVKSLHAKVAELSPTEIVGAEIVAQASGIIAKCEAKLKEVETVKAEYAKELVDLKEQTGLEL